MLAIAGVALVAAAYGTWLFSTQLGVGWYRDDGVYVLTAHSIAEGRGPHLDFLPGAPYATKYPLLWPAMLAGFLSLTGATWKDLTGPLVVAPNALLISLALLAFAALLRRSWMLPRSVVFLLVIALAINPATLEFARFPMSEVFFIALSLGAVALADAGGGKRTEMAAALLAVAAMHTRLAGVTLVSALLLAFAIRRHIRTFLFTGILATSSLGVWLLYLGHARAVDAAAHASHVLEYDLGYGGYWASHLPAPGDILIHAWQLVFFAAHSVFSAAYPMKLLGDIAQGGSSIPLIAVAAGLLVLLALGAKGRMHASGAVRPLARVETWYLPFAVLLILLWPTAVRRLLFPLLPWLLALAVLGLAFLTRSPRAVPLVGTAALVALALGSLSLNIPAGPGLFMADGAPVRVAPLTQALDVVRKLPPSARIGSPMAPLVYLHTGRLSVETWVGPQITGATMKGREPRTFYMLGGEPDFEQAERSVRDALREYPALGVRYGFSRKFPGRDFFLVIASRLPGAHTLFSSDDYELIVLPYTPLPERRAPPETETPRLP